MSRLSRITEKDEVVVIAGKVLGNGSMDHKLTVCSYSFSESAARKIVSAGGKVLYFPDLVREYPNGKGVRIVG